jgi:hypothetical protein
MASGNSQRVRKYGSLPILPSDTYNIKIQAPEECPYQHYHPQYVQTKNIDVIYQAPKYTLEQLQENRVISYDEIIKKKITSLCKQPPNYAYTHCDSMSLPCETTYFPCGINYTTLNKIYFALTTYKFKDNHHNYLNNPGAYVIIPYAANRLYIPEQQKGFGNTFETIITKKCNIPYHGLSETSEVVLFIGVDNEVWISIFNQ